MWYYESAARVEIIDLRWVMVCTGLESLVNTSKDRTTAQFTHRLLLMAKHLDVNVSKSELEKAYANRSSLVHGSGFPSVSSSSEQDSKVPQLTPGIPGIDLYDKCENLLRLAVLNSFRDAEFRRTFETDSNIEERWLLGEKLKRIISCPSCKSDVEC